MLNYLIVKANGEVELKTVKVIGLLMLNHAVDGYLEAITGPGWVGYCNEEGKLRRLPPNPLATKLAIDGGWEHNGDTLVGDVVFLGPEVNGYHTSVPTVLLKSLMS